MSGIKCKNCGGNITFDAVTKTIICDSCGTCKSLESIADQSFYDVDENTKEKLAEYKDAVIAMTIAESEDDFRETAEMFDSISDILDADDLAAECRTQAKELHTESVYNMALSLMESGKTDKIIQAKKFFAALDNYKDSITLVEKCDVAIEEARKKRMLREKEEARLAEKRRRKRSRMVFFLALLIIVFVIINSAIYSSKNIKITITPKESDYITEKYNDYVFNYDVKINNNGFVDIKEINGNVIFETENGEILVDTAIYFYNYSGAVARAKKATRFSWELTVSSYDTALAIYETDFHDINVIIDINRIKFSNGKTKNYRY